VIVEVLTKRKDVTSYLHGKLIDNYLTRQRLARVGVRTSPSRHDAWLSPSAPSPSA
jgi:hypothetical protein